MPVDISTMSPEEKQALLAQLQEEPCDPVEELANALDILVTKVEELEGVVGVLKKTVDDDLIGGIKGLYDENVRASGISDLKGKYGGLFEPYEKGLGELGVSDVYGELHDMLSRLKESPDYTDEMGDGKVREIAKMVGDKFSAISGKPVEVEKVEAAPVEEPKAEEEDPQAAIKRAVERMKAKEKK
jgi:hypothetical protein